MSLRETHMKILFVCTHNRCRSILGEAITRQLAGDRLEVRSAGAHPVGEVHPETIRHLQLRKFNISNLSSKSWNDLENFDPDIVITVCDAAANEACPVWMGRAAKIHWGLKDPSKLENKEERQNAFFQVMDILEKRMQTVLAADVNDMSETQTKQLFMQAGESL